MKIGLFSDVHGHLPELERTLHLFDSLNVDEIICCGDLVDKGTNSNDVIALIQERNIVTVQGNHDLKAQYKWVSQHETLRPEAIVFLTNLPPTMSFEWVGLKAFVCHANPWQDSSVYVYPDRPEALFQLVLDSVDADVIIMGHTHHAMCLNIGSRWIINPGSIYGNRDREERTCAVLSLPDCVFDLYDIDTGEQLSLMVNPQSGHSPDQIPDQSTFL